MNIWIAASVALSCGLVICLLACVRTDAAAALAALNLAGVVAVLDLITLTVGLDREPFIDLAVVLAPLSMGGSLAFARYLERGP